jgi:translation initiation factor IF-2
MAAQNTVVEIPAQLTVRELGEKLGISPVNLLKALIANGIMATITQRIDYETAAIVAEDLGFTLYLEGQVPPPAAPEGAAPPTDGTAEEPELVEAGPGQPWYLEGEDESALRPRPPVVTIMGHVDHGKTSILDAIRKTRVVAGESGGITQHIGAYSVTRGDKRITFIDTPGHEAFTAMRARGARATDIAVIVVAADDGVMPQTREAVDHARAAGVPIIVAINKMDLPSAKIDRLLDQISGLGLMPEEWGGDTFCIRVSAHTGMGLDELLEAILLVAEVSPPLANPDRGALGVVLEAEIDQQRGVRATLLVQSGTLRKGDMLVVGEQYSRVRAMWNDLGETVLTVPPGDPVAAIGLPHVPAAGSRFEVVKNEKTARALVEARNLEARPGMGTERPLTLEELFTRAQQAEIKTLNLIVKTDVHGSLEPVVTALERLSGAVKVKVLLADTGEISESDVNLAVASGAVVLGFRVSPDVRAARAAASQRVEIREYDIIYKLVEDIQDALTGMLEPVYEAKTIGRAEVRAIFGVPRAGNVAGSAVLSGTIRRNATVRVLRGNQQVAESAVSSMKRFTEDVREVREGFECGIGLAAFDDFKVGDILEFFVKERVK